MSFAPKHDFHQFEAAIAMARLDVERQASPMQKAERFAELVSLSRCAEKPDALLVDRQNRWLIEKLPIRLREIAAFNSED
ncbi:hypothetical protein [Stieleria neptunia]|nr:hypothetical protein [Stieleria neptunia]